MIKHEQFQNFYEVNHPLIQHKLTEMRQTVTGKEAFKSRLHEIALLMTYELTSKLAVFNKKIATPLCETEKPALKDDAPVIVPILRAGLGMSAAVEELIPNAIIGHVGVYRDHNTKEAKEYLVKLPNIKGKDILLIDPMLATGNSAKYVVDILIKHGAEAKNIKFLCLVAAPEGVEVIDKAYPEIEIYCASLDSHLNENAYIVPGLGDAGDRLLGTV